MARDARRWRAVAQRNRRPAHATKTGERHAKYDATPGAQSDPAHARRHCRRVCRHLPSRVGGSQADGRAGAGRAGRTGRRAQRRVRQAHGARLARQGFLLRRPARGSARRRHAHARGDVPAGQAHAGYRSLLHRRRQPQGTRQRPQRARHCGARGRRQGAARLGVRLGAALLRPDARAVRRVLQGARARSGHGQDQPRGDRRVLQGQSGDDEAGGLHRRAAGAGQLCHGAVLEHQRVHRRPVPRARRSRSAGASSRWPAASA